MRKFIAIAFLFVFTVLQYGKIASWLYCELRVEITNQKTTHCDCEKIVADNNKQEPASTPHSHTLKDKLSEPYTTSAEEIISAVVINTSCFSSIANHLQAGFPSPLYHPPSIS